ncbi:MAG: hypothetical protein WCO94_02975 [Verrucomicrobiota bacterium]
MKCLHMNDGSTEPPKLQVYLNLDNLVDLRPDTIWPGLHGLARMERLAADGFQGVQITDDSLPVTGSPIPHCGLDRINLPEEADAIAAKHEARGDQCLTVHAGWGIEDDDEVFRLVEAILVASEKHRLPIFIETHRATITQDIWRTVQIAKQFPEIRFNGDFSHYYCGQEMVYGGLEMKLAFMAPIFDRVAFMHGRVASPGCMQMPVDDPGSRPSAAAGVVDYFADFRKIWTLAMRGFLKHAGPGDILIFAPELLAGTHYYARLVPNSNGQMVEESDRYAQALIYKEAARACFLQASRSRPDTFGATTLG